MIQEEKDRGTKDGLDDREWRLEDEGLRDGVAGGR